LLSTLNQDRIVLEPEEGLQFPRQQTRGVLYHYVVIMSNTQIKWLTGRQRSS